MATLEYMRTYELFFILPGTLTEEESGKRAAEVLSALQEAVGTAELHSLGKNRLAYPIRHIRYGYYFTAVFSAEPAAVTGLVERLRLSRDLLRVFLTYFNVNLASREQIAYATESRPSAWEKVAPALAPAVAIGAPVGAAMPSLAPPPPLAKPLAEPDLAAINKKLEELIGGATAVSV